MAHSSLIFLSFFLLFSSATCFNITKILDTYPSFSTFNDYLTQSQLFAEINSRQTITVLVVDNSAISALSGRSVDVLKRIMSVHVVLDYYDLAKLQDLSKHTALLTTLFQSSGVAVNQQGFLNVSALTTGTVAFGSAVKGSNLSSNLVKSVAAQPYNISVLQVSSVIIPAGIDNLNTNSSSNSNSTKSSPPPSVTPAASPKKSPATPRARSPTKAPPADSPKSSQAPAPTDDADAPTVGDSPLSSPPLPDAADGPSDDQSTSDADAPSTSKSSATRMRLGTFVLVAMAVVSAWIAL